MKLKTRIADLEHQLDAQEQENKKITQSLLEMTRKTKADQEKFERLNKKTELDRQELAELRSFVFAEDEDIEDISEENSRKVEFPYTVKNKTIVFGGRVSSTTSMKAMLEGNIRFMDHHMLPSSDIVKNSVCIWIQAKCIAHKNCFRILDLARANGIPIHYFSCTSATKCAEQIAIVDQAYSET